MAPKLLQRYQSHDRTDNQTLWRLSSLCIATESKNIHKIFSAENRQKNKNVQPGPEKQYSYETLDKWSG